MYWKIFFNYCQLSCKSCHVITHKRELLCVLLSGFIKLSDDKHPCMEAYCYRFDTWLKHDKFVISIKVSHLKWTFLITYFLSLYQPTTFKCKTFIVATISLYDWHANTARMWRYDNINNVRYVIISYVRRLNEWTDENQYLCILSIWILHFSTVIKYISFYDAYDNFYFACLIFLLLTLKITWHSLNIITLDKCEINVFWNHIRS